ncbi:hypothetical protein QTI66_32730 [Variovorax sp. J22R133]|uniref:hypothetical protein n=1 Tax=Variovorax brevis TaxID=3053503 RepID=UPI0025788065|nr:hypothetical protein [Variovorax sp. J22R133]MDM0116894.1 hypothetical protein [Variovorax sp. J22R133]
MVRCPECRTRRVSWIAMLKHVAKTGHKVCDCGHGYHFPHRPGSGGCIRRDWDELLGEPRAQAHPQGAPCPF